jgi:quercetin dioxygenase-like cupin family protein
MVSATPEGPTFFHVDELAWSDETTRTAPRELVDEARRAGAKRKFLAQGQGGFYSQLSVFPSGYTVPMHRHDHDEMIVVLEGAATMLEGGPTLTVHDSMVLHGGYAYGFTAGPEGLTFLTIRTGAAQTQLTEPG